jgi:hypothetical protein
MLNHILNQMFQTERSLELTYYAKSGFKYKVLLKQLPEAEGNYLEPPISLMDVGPDSDGIQAWWPNKELEFVNMEAFIIALNARWAGMRSYEEVQQ